jgi:hypothetical protein
MRWCARAGSIVAVVAWLILLAVEWFQHGSPDLRSLDQVYQAAALAVVFAGYALGWRYELAGGLVAVFGTIAFAAVWVWIFAVPPTATVAWFAAPGLLYILAWYSSHKHGQLIL